MSEFIKAPPAQPQAVTDQVVATVGRILADVEREGEPAIRRYSRELDGWDPPEFRVSPETIERAYQSIDPVVREHAEFTIAQVKNFARLQRQTMVDFEVETMPGVILGQRHMPVGAIGANVYVVPT